jgi:hypothetical protein
MWAQDEFLDVKNLNPKVPSIKKTDIHNLPEEYSLNNGTASTTKTLMVEGWSKFKGLVAKDINRPLIINERTVSKNNLRIPIRNLSLDRRKCPPIKVQDKNSIKSTVVSQKPILQKSINIQKSILKKPKNDENNPDLLKNRAPLFINQGFTQSLKTPQQYKCTSDSSVEFPYIAASLPRKVKEACSMKGLNQEQFLMEPWLEEDNVNCSPETPTASTLTYVEQNTVEKDLMGIENFNDKMNIVSHDNEPPSQIIRSSIMDSTEENSMLSNSIDFNLVFKSNRETATRILSQFSDTQLRDIQSNILASSVDLQSSDTEALTFEEFIIDLRRKLNTKEKLKISNYESFSSERTGSTELIYTTLTKKNGSVKKQQDADILTSTCSGESYSEDAILSLYPTSTTSDSNDAEKYYLLESESPDQNHIPINEVPTISSLNSNAAKDIKPNSREEKKGDVQEQIMIRNNFMETLRHATEKRLPNFQQKVNLHELNRSNTSNSQTDKSTGLNEIKSPILTEAVAAQFDEFL